MSVVTERTEGLTDDIFVGKRPVELDGVEEGDPTLSITLQRTKAPARNSSTRISPFLP
jgi:hypothetical protein